MKTICMRNDDPRAICIAAAAAAAAAAICQASNRDQKLDARNYMQEFNGSQWANNWWANISHVIMASCSILFKKARRQRDALAPIVLGSSIFQFKPLPPFKWRLDVRTRV